jgi:hypothetical protein
MIPPDVITTGRDEGNNLTFQIVAYRKLSDDEAIQIVANYLRGQKGPKLQNQVIKIQTVIGLIPGM